MMLNCISWFWYKRQSSSQNLLYSPNEENLCDKINTQKPNLKQPLKLALYYMTMDKVDINNSNQDAISNNNQAPKRRPESLGPLEQQDTTMGSLEAPRSSSPPITPPFYSAPSSPPPEAISSPPTEAELSTPPTSDQEDGDEEEYIVRRTLSLKTSRTPPGVSPNHLKGAKKVVRFADSLGLDLEVVRMYPDWDQPPEGIQAAAAAASRDAHPHEPILAVTTTATPAQLEPPAAKALPPLSVDFAVVPTAAGKSRMPRHGGSGAFLRHAHDAREARLAFPSLSLRVGNAMSGKYLSPTFPQPGASYNFLRRVKEQKVCLERITNKPSKCTISGTVVVENIAFHKTVYVRYTVDDWITHSDHLCTYVIGSTKTTPLPPASPSPLSTGAKGPPEHHNSLAQNSICTDVFSFEIVIPFSLTVGSNMYLAILLRAGGREYWDNNGGANYQLRCYAAPIKPIKAPKASTSKPGSPEAKPTQTSSSAKRTSPTPIITAPVPSTLHNIDDHLLTRLKQSVEALDADSAKPTLSNDLSSVDEGLTRPNSLFGGSVKRTSRVGNNC